MKNYFSKRSWAILILIILFGLMGGFLFVRYTDLIKWRPEIKIVRAGSGDNVNGFAWDSNYGWISFNSTELKAICDLSPVDDVVDNPIPDPICPIAGTVIYDYGVNIVPATGVFSGYAWSSNIGWISFNETPSDTSFRSNCLPAGCGGTCSACYNNSDDKIYGWAKIIALGDDGWIRFDDHNGTGNAPDYGVTIASNDFQGWAWNGNGNGVGLGWVSFNCANPDDDIDCGVVNYKVSAALNAQPGIINMTAPNWDEADACGDSGQALGAVLQWEYTDPDSDIGTAYQIVVTNESSGAEILNTGKCTGQNVCDGCADPNLCTTMPNCLNNPGGCTYRLNNTVLADYNTPYSWQVQVWDNLDTPSGLKDYNAPLDTDNDDSNSTTFTTYAHEFPDPDDFIWYLPIPSLSEEIMFVSTSSAKYFTAASPATPIACEDDIGDVEGVSDNCNWYWEIIDPTAGVIGDANASSTIITFIQTLNQQVQLTITDPDGYFCRDTKDISIRRKLPTWFESR